jgi:signal transduction histidine kinase
MVDVTSMASELAARIEGEDPARRVEWSIAPGLVVSADRRLLRIALDNLLRNAWKFSRDRDPARIEIGSSADGDRAIYVQDNGIGFDPQYAGKLFRAFERLHPIEEFEGTGIGLALVRRIVVRHGGRVWAEAEPQGGATFYFTLSPEPATAGSGE